MNKRGFLKQAFSILPFPLLSRLTLATQWLVTHKSHFLLKQQATSHVTFGQPYAAFMHLHGCYSDSPSSSLQCASAYSLSTIACYKHMGKKCSVKQFTVYVASSMF